MAGHLAATRRIFLVMLVAVGLLGASLVQASRANAFTWPANSWGDCNTKRPFADGYTMYFNRVVTNGHPYNWSGDYCLYWGRSNRIPGGLWPFTMSVNWSRACALDAGGRYYWVTWRAPDSTYWCNV